MITKQLALRLTLICTCAWTLLFKNSLFLSAFHYWCLKQYEARPICFECKSGSVTVQLLDPFFATFISRRTAIHTKHLTFWKSYAQLCSAIHGIICNKKVFFVHEITFIFETENKYNIYKKNPFSIYLYFISK